ncbi:MAG: energy transducer TonB, partial [Candidatus Acidiferrum sp.]
VQSAPAPPRPHIEISETALAKLHPRQHRFAAAKATPLPDVPTNEQKPADITFATSAEAPARPKLDLNANAAPRLAARSRAADSAPAPQIGAAQAAAANGSPSTLIALSAEPAPPKPDVQPPAGNLAARVSMSPEGKKPGVPASALAAGKSPVGISISGGNPKPNTVVSTLGGPRLKLSLPSSRDLAARPDPDGPSEHAAQRTGPPNFSMLAPGAKPEQIFSDKRVFTLNVQMANLNSASGSWILHFSELDSASGSNGGIPRTSSPADLTGLAPIRKVDPKYPPALIEQNIEGDVVLYAVIRADGSVDSIQVVRSVDPQLDANAKSALSQWKFRPAMKDGVPVPLEAIVHVPFRLPDER